jgi:hypothetical protein
MREKKMYLRGALDRAYFHRMRRVTIYQIDVAGKLCRNQTRTLSYIKAKRLMHQELRYQVKTHKISEKLKLWINVCIFLPPIFFKKKIKRRKKNKNMLHNKEDSIVQACKVKANLTSGREVW